MLARPADRRSVTRFLSAGAFVVPLAVYAASLLPGVGFWDTAEMQTVPYIFGIAHPPGFPAFVLLGYLFSHLFAIGNVAWRLSLMSALALAGATWFAFRTLADEKVHPLLACLCAWAFAFGAIAWTRATRAEVHALAIFFIAGAVWSALRARASGARAPLYLCALSVGLAAATHPVVIWIAPGLLVLLLPVFRNHLRPNSDNAATYASAAALAVAPLLLYLYMPLRSAVLAARRMDPTLALGVPPGQPFWDYGHTADLHRFILHLSGAQFPKTAALAAVFRPSAYPGFAATFASKTFAEFGIVICVLAIAGIVALIVRDRSKALGLILIMAAGLPFALSYAIEIDYDRYLLTAYWIVAIFAGIGAQALCLARHTLCARFGIAIVAAFLFLSDAYTVDQNRDIFAQRNDRSGEAFIERIVRETPPRTVIGAPWIFATPLAYAAYVEHRLDSRIVESARPEDVAARLAGWAKTRPVFMLYFETGPVPVPGARVQAVDTTTPALYRVVPKP